MEISNRMLIKLGNNIAFTLTWWHADPGLTTQNVNTSQQKSWVP